MGAANSRCGFSAGFRAVRASVPQSIPRRHPFIPLAGIERRRLTRVRAPTTPTSDHRPSANVSGTVVPDREPPTCDYFQKSESVLIRVARDPTPCACGRASVLESCREDGPCTVPRVPSSGKTKAETLSFFRERSCCGPAKDRSAPPAVDHFLSRVQAAKDQQPNPRKRTAHSSVNEIITA